MIRIESLGKTYGSRARPVDALRGVTLDVGPGVTAVVGPNGAGKTTLLGLVLGFLRPTKGTVRIDELRPRDYLRRRGAGYLPERFRLPSAWPAGTALRTLAQLEGLPRGEAEQRAAEALDRLGLEEHEEKAMGALSRGLNQRVGLAQALLADRDVVVLDEPTEGLDPLWRVRFRDIVDDLRSRNRTVVLASHELSEVERLADRAVLLDRGEVREVMELRTPTSGPLRYRLEVGGPEAALAAAFPGAEPVEAGPPDAGAAAGGAAGGGPAPEGERDRSGAGGDRQSFLVGVSDAGELSNRLEAFLGGGGIVHRVVPEGERLEERVRRRLGES